MATADHTARPHLVPLSLYGDGSFVVVATLKHSRTTNNLELSHLARLAIGNTRDVTLIDAVADIMELAGTDDLSDRFIEHTGWDPRTATGEWTYLRFRPVQVQSWLSEAELEGRTLMNQGRWLC